MKGATLKKAEYSESNLADLEKRPEQAKVKKKEECGEEGNAKVLKKACAKVKTARAKVNAPKAYPKKDMKKAMPEGGDGYGDKKKEPPTDEVPQPEPHKKPPKAEDEKPKPKKKQVTVVDEREKKPKEEPDGEEKPEKEKKE